MIHRLFTVLFLISLGFNAVRADVTIDADNPLTITPSSIPTGTITFNSGTLKVTTGTTTLTNAVVVNGTNTIDTQARLILNGTLTGSGSIKKTNGTDQLHFSGDASGFSGTVTVSANWINFVTPGGASASANYVLDTTLNGSGIVFSTSNSTTAGANTFQLGMLETTNTKTEVRVSSGMPSDATVQVGGESKSGTFAGQFLDFGGKKINLEKVGTGTWTISSAQTHTGTTTLKNGTLCIAAGYTSPITVEDGTLQLGTSGKSSTVSSLTLSGGATQLLSGSVTITNTTFNGGKITGSNSVTLQNINLAAGTSSTIGATGYSNVQGNVTGSGTLTFDGKASAGNQLHISGSANVSGNVFTGTIISEKGGWVAFRSTDSTSSSAKYQSTNGGNIGFYATGTSATFKLGELSSTGNSEVRSLMANECRAITLEVGGANTDAVFKGCISDYSHGTAGTDIFSVTKVGTGTWTISNEQKFTGDTNVNGGTLCINGNYNSPVYVNNGGTLTGTGAFQNGVEVKINAGGTLSRNMAQDVTLNGGTFSGAYTLTNVQLADGVTSYAVPSGKAYVKGSLSGTGTLIVNGSKSVSNQLWFQGDNSSFAGTIISDNNGYVSLQGGASSSASAKYQVTNAGSSKEGCGGFIFVSSTTDSGIYQLGELSGGGEFRAGNNSEKEQILLKVGALNTDATFSGYIYDHTSGHATGTVLSMEKVGTGSWTLTGKNEYTGSTTVSGGNLIVGSKGSITSTSSVTVANGACLTVNGTLTSTGGITVENGGSISGLGTIKAPITFTGNAAYTLNLTDSTTRASVIDGKTLELTGDVSGPLTLDLIGDEASMKAFETAQGSEVVTFDALKVLTSNELIATLNNMTPGVYSLSTIPLNDGGYMLRITGSLNANAVPEPAAWILFLIGLGLLRKIKK